ncbi:MAG: hypothetical protein JXD22_14225 [Sedimentisphaerales bacterium]|nr:hypothetical protein [Sedimentisphaerales bacterium]
MQKLKKIEIEKLEYGQILTIETHPHFENILPCEDYTALCWSNHIMSYIFTKLSNSGTILAEKSDENNQVVWKYSPQINRKHKPPEMSEIILEQNLTRFRTVLGHFGLAVMDEGYFGACTFSMRFFDKPNEKIHVAYSFSNTSDTGFWIRLQTMDRQ